MDPLEGTSTSLSSPSSHAWAIELSDHDPKTYRDMLLVVAELPWSLTSNRNPPIDHPWLADRIVKGKVWEDRDAKGDTIFHKKLRIPVLSLLLSLSPSSVVDTRDRMGRTPMMRAAERGGLDEVILHISRGGDVNARDEEGNTSLHLAAKHGFDSVAKALLLFAAKSEEDNSRTEKPIDLLQKKLLSMEDVVEAKSGWMSSLLSSASQMVLEWTGEAVSLRQNTLHSLSELSLALKLARGEGITTDTPISETDTYRLKCAMENLKNRGTEKDGECVQNILSLDGGGIRGLVLIQMLADLEAILGSPIVSKFQWIAGTSTGAILALALSRGRTIDECRQLYFRLKDVVFSGGRPYSSDIIETFLKEEFGEHSLLSDIHSARLLVTACDANRFPARLHLFRNYKLLHSDDGCSQEGLQDPHNARVWFAARCSSAAPSFFPCVEGKWMDGGLMANNPIGLVLNDFHTYNMERELQGKEQLRLGAVVSLGTGIIKARQVDPSVSLNMQFSSPLASIETMKHLAKIMIEQITSSDGQVVSLARTAVAKEKAAFFRFSPSFDEEISLDETNNEILIEMMWTAKKYIREQRRYVEKLCEFIR